MDFGEALSALKSGQRVARAGWNGKGMWLAHVAGQDQPAAFAAYSIKSDHVASDYAPAAWIGMKTADDKFVPWLASQTDILAEDWTVLG
jgi:hypothetical protein